MTITTPEIVALEKWIVIIITLANTGKNTGGRTIIIVIAVKAILTLVELMDIAAVVLLADIPLDMTAAIAGSRLIIGISD